MIIAYVARHGSTDLSPKPEGWLPISLNAEGRMEVTHAASAMQQFIRQGNPKPKWGVSGDLPRTQETLAILSDYLGLRRGIALPELRAYEAQKETPAEYEERNCRAWGYILSESKTRGIPLVACHRSTTSFLGKYYSETFKKPDYRYDALLLEGGVMAIEDDVIYPIFRPVEKNWPGSGVMKDGRMLLSKVCMP